MRVADGLPFSHYSLKDDEGRELLRVMYRRSGRLVVTWGEGIPFRAGCSGAPDGVFSLWVEREGFNYDLSIRPDATSGLTVTDRRRGIRDGLAVTPGGRLVHGPSVLD